MPKLSQKITEIFDQDTYSLNKVVSILEENVFGFLLLILAIPSALPIPAVGYSVPFGILIVTIGSQLLIGRQKLYLPKKLSEKEFKSPSDKAKTRLIKFLNFFENLSRPRLKLVSSSRAGAFLLGLFIILCGISMIIPIPGTNTIPAFAIFILSIALLEEDGLFGILGILAAIIGIAVTVSILFFGGVLYGFIKGLLGF